VITASAGCWRGGGQLHGHEYLPAAAEAAGGLDVRAGLTDQHVEQLAGLLVLHHLVFAADQATPSDLFDLVRAGNNMWARYG
jgi:hypothetical protein